MTKSREIDLAKMRKRSGLNQRDFWARVGVTQSGGCRYEGGRQMPKPVRMLVPIAYGTAADRQRAIRALHPTLIAVVPKGSSRS